MNAVLYQQRSIVVLDLHGNELATHPRICFACSELDGIIQPKKSDLPEVSIGSTTDTEISWNETAMALARVVLPGEGTAVCYACIASLGGSKLLAWLTCEAKAQAD